MSWKDCADSIRQAAGRDLTDDQVIQVFEAVDRRKKALLATGQIDNLDARLRELVAEDADKLRIEAALAKKHAALSVIARDRATRLIEQHIRSGLSYRKAVLALFEGTTRGVESGRRSIAATKLAYESRYVGGMMARIVREVPHAEGLLSDRAFLDDVVREMIELGDGGTPGRTGNADAQKVAKIFSDYAEMSRQDLNRLGANIGKLDGWAGAQIHDGDKIGRVSVDEWIDAILPKLDLARTFPDLADEAAVRAALRNVWQNIVFGPDRGPAPRPADSGFTGPPNVARALERHRVLHFRSADDWLAYSREFGQGHIFDGMIHHLSRAALNAAQMEMLGPNPGATLKAVLAAVKSRVDVDSDIPPAEKAKVKEGLTDDPQSSIGAAFRIASGAAMIPVSRTVADVAGTVRAAESMAKLGGAVISSVSDLGTAMVNLRFNGMSFGEVIRSQIEEFLRGRGKGEARELAYLLGEGFDGVLGRIISPYVANDGAPGAMQSVMATFFRWSGLSWWTDAQRAGAARILSAHLGRNASKEFGALNARLRHVLAQHGITPEMWEVIRRYGVRKIDGRDYLTPEGLAAVPDEAVLPLARDRVNAIEAGLAERATANAREDMPQRIARALDDTRRDLELAVRRYFADEAQSSVLEADAATQRITTLGLSRGTLAGEAIRFVMQFKAFPIAFTQRVMGRAWQGGEGGKSAGAAHIGALIASTFVLGYAAMTAKDAVRGYAPKELVDEDGNPNWKTILAAAVQGGGAGIYGDFLFGEASRSGNTALENLAGPALSDLARWLTLYSRARDGDAKAGEALTAALSSTPFANMFYLRPALDYLILNSLRDYLSPGYLARQDQRRREQFGQDPLIAPSDRMAFDLF